MENMIRPAFESKRFEEERAKDKRKVVPVSFNLQELKELNEIMKILKQDQKGTAIKQLMKIGFLVIQDEKIRQIIDILFINKRNVIDRRGVTI